MASRWPNSASRSREVSQEMPGSASPTSAQNDRRNAVPSAPNGDSTPTEPPSCPTGHLDRPSRSRLATAQNDRPTADPLPPSPHRTPPAPPSCPTGPLARPPRRPGRSPHSSPAQDAEGRPPLQRLRAGRSRWPVGQLGGSVGVL